MRTRRLPPMLLCLLALPALAAADAIEGVQPASIDQPRIYLNLRTDPKGPVLGAPKPAAEGGAPAKRADGLDDPIFAGLDLAPPPPSTVAAFLDTGASGILLSKPTADGLKLTAEKGAVFYDVGVGGSEAFGISTPVYVDCAPYSSATDGGNASAYAPAVGPARLQLARGGGILDALTGGTDVAGMPVMVGRVVVIDARPANTFSDVLRTAIVAPGDPSIPKTDATVPLTYVPFARFTKTTPAAAAPPTLDGNPMIGPSPLDPAGRAAPVTFTHGGKTATGTMLLDTGAAASMISTAVAAKLGITYAPDGSTLLGVPKDRQFSLPLGGVGGAKTVTGFYLDSLALPAKAGQPVIYVKAPVLVNDISVVDAKTGQKLTLDGVFGMNFLVASANITGGLIPDLGKMSEGAFDFIVIDHKAGELRLKRR